jgi:RNA polymerase sigma-70 factor (ECF subfamily)
MCDVNCRSQARPDLPACQSFETTHWTVVLSAADTSAPGAQAALEDLCRTYWYPLYTYVRRQGHTVEDAQDLTQEFFARFLERKYFRLAGRPRAWAVSLVSADLAETLPGQ